MSPGANFHNLQLTIYETLCLFMNKFMTKTEQRKYVSVQTVWRGVGYNKICQNRLNYMDYNTVYN